MSSRERALISLLQGAEILSTEVSSSLVERSPSQRIEFTARKVQLANAYYVVATVPGQMKCRIGAFATRAQAREWIDAHAASWTSAQLEDAAYVLESV